MIVYIEYVLIDNFVIDYLLIKTTLDIVGVKANKLRLVFCALLGSVIALFYPLVEGVLAVAIPLKLLVGLLLVALSRKHKNFRALYIDMLTFTALTFFSGGAIIGLFNLFNISYSTEIVVSIMFLPVYFVLKFCTEIIKYFYRKRGTSSFIAKVELFLGEKVIERKGFFDTGNRLYHNGKPVIVCAKEVLEEFIKLAPQRIKLKKMSFNTISGKDQSFCFDLDSIRIYYQGKLNIYNNVTACISKGVIGDDYQVILHTDFLEGENDKFSKIQTKKVS